VSAVGRLLPDRQTLSEWLTLLRLQTEANRNRLAGLARAVLSVLQTDPRTVRWHPGLAMAADGVTGLRAVLEAWRTPTDLLHVDAMDSLNQALKGYAPRADRTELEQFEAELSASSDKRLRWLAVTALWSAAQDGLGWTGARRARLERYRADPAPLVAGAAQFTFPPAEAELRPERQG